MVGLAIRKSGWELMSAALKDNRSVRILVVNFCEMDDDIVTKIAPAIGFNIHTLDLSNNDIREHGA